MTIETKYSLGDFVNFKERADGETKQGVIVRITATRGEDDFYSSEDLYTIISGDKFYSIFDEGVLGLVKDSV